MKQDIEYAAMVMADSMPRTELHKRGGLWMPSYGYYWNPLDDDGNSRRLEAASLNWIRENTERVTDAVSDAESHLICTRYENNLQAFRAAVFALAVAIGKTMEGNDNAG